MPEPRVPRDSRVSGAGHPAPPRRVSRLLPTLLAGFLALTGASNAHAGVRVLTSDARGVTLKLTVGAWSVSAPDADGRVRVKGLADAHTMGIAEIGRAHV